MRRRLILVFLAVSTMVTMAFVVPLGFLVQRTAEDRAIDSARADAAAVVPALVADGTQIQIEAAINGTLAGRAGHISVVTSQGWSIGPSTGASERVAAALTLGISDVGDTSGGVEIVAAVASGSGDLSAIRVFVPDAELSDGLWRAWGALAGVGVVLVGISVLVADSLARTIVRPTQHLAQAARSLGDGDLDATVVPEGPAELIALGAVFNDVGARVSSMLIRERELVAELSHRLRTPLTKLHLRLDQVEDADLAAELRGDVDDLTGVVNGLIQEVRGKRVEEQACDLAEVVNDRVKFWRVLADDQMRPLSLENVDRPLRVGVSSADLAAVVDVLLQNVFAHTSDDTAMAVGFGERDGFAQLWVADAGTGFDASLLQRGESAAGSTGLGLDIARRMAMVAGGSLEVRTSDMGGTEVMVSLPLLRDNSP